VFLLFRAHRADSPTLLFLSKKLNLKSQLREIDISICIQVRHYCRLFTVKK